jgi:membrane-bound lytic murein transglycosylase B
MFAPRKYPLAVRGWQVEEAMATGAISIIMHDALMLYTLRASRRLSAHFNSMKKFPVLLIQALTLAVLTASPVHPAHTASTAHPSSIKKKPIGKSRSVKAKSGQKARSKSKTPIAAPEFANFTQWQAVDEFIDEMCRDHGFERDTLRSLFGQVHYLDNVVKLINPPPVGAVKNWSAYRARFIEPRRLNAGAKFWNRYATELDRAHQEFGVPAEIIIGVLGVETMYGQAAGKFRVLDSLTTLAFAYPETANREPRMAYFRNELKQALLFARESNIDPLSLHGSFAGAIGWPQFMPGSIRRYAVDFDGDGKIDLRNSAVDAIGSIASFLSQHGWQRDQPLVFPVQVTPDRPWPSLIGKSLEAKFSRDELRLAGVIVPDDVPVAHPYGLFDLEDGSHPTRYLLGTQNFFAITHYNRSYYYAMAVIELGQAISRHRIR